jgi:hypothetical protein
MKFKLLFILSILILFSACSNNSDYEFTEEDIFNINLLYEHTIMMVELSTPEQVESLGIDGTNLKRNNLLTPIEKEKLLEEAYGLDLGSKRFDKKLEILEDEMIEMMKNWDYE